MAGTVVGEASHRRWRNLLDGRHAHLEVDDGLGWIVVYRGQAPRGDDAVNGPVPRVRHLARQAATRNPNRALGPDEVPLVWPERNADRSGM